MSNRTIHGLWIGNKLSPVEILTIRSFIAQGHEFNLWAYDDIVNLPGGVNVMPAEDIIDAQSVFSYRHKNAYGHGKGSYAGFSDIFRYKLLYEKGGIYVDMDITCLKPFDFEDEYLFRFHHKFGCVGNIMKCPAGAEVMDYCYKRAIGEVTEENKRWELPIEILNEGVIKFGHKGRIRAISNNDSWPIVAAMISGRKQIPDDWYAIHWMNEEWRHLGLQKNCVIDESNLADLYREYEVGDQLQLIPATMRQRILLSRWYYLFVNLKHKAASLFSK